MKRQKCLVVTTKDRSIPIPGAIRVLATCDQVHIISLGKRQLRRVGLHLWLASASSYSAVLLDLPHKKMVKQWRRISKLPNVIIYQEDACQEFIDGAKWQGSFTPFFQKIPGSTIISTGFYPTRRFRERGLDVRFIPKGFNELSITDEHRPYRDIEIGFIGRMGASAYRQRAEMLQAAEDRLDCRLMKTSTLNEYNQLLNRIRFFFSCDKGLHEYMTKNFEAMAAGCILVAYRQGNGEEEALGMSDMENCLLYSSIDEAEKKIVQLRKNPQLREQIRKNGTEHARANFSHSRMGEQVLQVLLEKATQGRPGPSHQGLT